MKPKPPTFEVTCPCCGARLTLDSNLGEVVAHEPPPKKHLETDLSEAARKLKEQEGRRDEVFRKSMEAEKKRGQVLEKKFEEAYSDGKYDLMFYVGGADPYCEDQLGGLGLTLKGLERRDDMVFAEARKRKLPVAVTLAGGYARRVEDTVEIHVNTIRRLKEAL